MQILEKVRKNRKVLCWGVFFLALLLVDIFLFWKSHYGYGANDESFYLTTAHRLSKGDALLSEEWHMSQMSAFLVYPIMKIYLAIAGTTEGILLHFRWIFIVVKSLIATAGMKLLYKKYGYFAAVAMSIYMLFTPYNLLQLCYNSMGLSFLMLAGIMLISIEHEGNELTWKCFGAGIFLACAVLCCPYLATLYVLMACVAVICWKKKKNAVYMKGIGFLTMGCAVMAVLFMIFVLSRTSLGEIFANIPEMLKDPEHPVQSVVTSMVNLLLSFVQFYPVATIAWVIEIFLVLAETVYLRRKKAEYALNNGYLYIMIMAICVIITLVQLANNIFFTYNLIMVPLVYLGSLIYLIAFCEKNSQMSRGPLILGGMGIYYGILLNMSSNNQLNIFSCASAIATVATILTIGEYIRTTEIPHKWKQWGGRVCMGSAIVVQLLIIVLSVSQHAFWETRVSDLKSQVEFGPLKGIYTSEEHALEYENTLKDLMWLTEQPEGKFAYFSAKPYVYLYVDMPYGTHSGWSGEFPTQVFMGENYYNLHEDKIPDYVYVEKAYITGEDVSQTALQNGYQVKELDYGYLLVK